MLYLTDLTIGEFYVDYYRQLKLTQKVIDIMLGEDYSHKYLQEAQPYVSTTRQIVNTMMTVHPDGELITTLEYIDGANYLYDDTRLVESSYYSFSTGDYIDVSDYAPED